MTTNEAPTYVCRGCSFPTVYSRTDEPPAHLLCRNCASNQVGDLIDQLEGTRRKLQQTLEAADDPGLPPDHVKDILRGEIQAILQVVGKVDCQHVWVKYHAPEDLELETVVWCRDCGVHRSEVVA